MTETGGRGERESVGERSDAVRLQQVSVWGGQDDETKSEAEEKVQKSCSRSKSARKWGKGRKIPPKSSSARVIRNLIPLYSLCL